MKTILLTSLPLMLSFSAFASDVVTRPNMGEPHDKMDIMAQLTDEQKSCVRAYGCVMPEKPEKIELGEQSTAPANEHEMDQGQHESMDCMRRAMESCGVEMPRKPDVPNAERPELPNGEKPEIPQPNAQ